MNYDRGSSWIAEVAGQRREALVLSNSTFARRYGRVLLAPDAGATDDEPRRPGWVGVTSAYFDVTKITAVPLARLLEPRGTVSKSVMSDARRIVNEALR